VETIKKDKKNSSPTVNEILAKRMAELEKGLIQAQQECAQIEQILAMKRQAMLRIDGALSECKYLLEQEIKHEGEIK